MTSEKPSGVEYRGARSLRRLQVRVRSRRLRVLGEVATGEEAVGGAEEFIPPCPLPPCLPLPPLSPPLLLPSSCLLHSLSPSPKPLSLPPSFLWWFLPCVRSHQSPRSGLSGMCPWEATGRAHLHTLDCRGGHALLATEMDPPGIMGSLSEGLTAPLPDPRAPRPLGQG